MEKPMEEPNGGGLVLQTKDLQKVLNDQNCIGLAFGVNTPGKATNVDLKVYKVSHDGTQFVGQVCSISRKKGASSVSGDSGGLNDYKFEFHSKMNENKFDFAFISREDFAFVVNNGEKEVFIGGGTKSYGEMGLVKGEWFTLTISPRGGTTRGASIRDLSLPPQMKHLESCPPRWTIEPNGYSVTETGKQFKFRPAE